MNQYFSHKNIIKSITGMLLMMTIVCSCNKDVEQLGDIAQPQHSGQTLDQLLRSNPDDSLYYRLMIKGGQVAMIADSNKSFTMFVPDNNAMKRFISVASGGLVLPQFPPVVFSQFITNFITVEQAAALVQYNTIPQSITTSSIPSDFPNFFYPSTFNPAPTLSSLFRLNVYPSTINGNWVNNIPLTSVNTIAYNGVIHHSRELMSPPGISTNLYLWDRINSDTALTYLKAAIVRADSGTASPGFLQGALSNIGANLTVFAPTNTAFKRTLTKMIAMLLIRSGSDTATAMSTASSLASTPDVFSNPLLYSTLTAQQVKGLIAYHLLDSRAFTNNFSKTPNPTTTLLGVPVVLRAKFGTPYVDSATVKGMGNPRPANIIINSTPLTADPDGTSDQLYLNGILHQIDDILMPQ